MLTLPELQAAFADGLGGRSCDRLLDMIAGDSISADARVRIHRNHVRQSLAAALATTFPTVTSLVGGAFFDGMAKAFVADSPPEGPVLAEYGEDLAVFIEAFAPAHGLPYLADAARLDWALNLAFYAARVPRREAGDFGSVRPERLAALTLTLAADVTLLTSAYPLGRIWRACQPDAPDAEVDLAAGGVSLLVMRQGDDAVFADLDPGCAAFVGAIGRGVPVGEAAQLAQANWSAFDPAQSFRRLLEWQIFAAGSAVVGPVGYEPIFGRIPSQEAK
ncbi:MAG: DUF2063 domain-containing protein [Reyranella sp.]|uniref:HvfC/BufC N-terminal domain-containing protein n=1 Tax=Reyranella sp. TaxID=1929291 RepID=UPI00121FA211|nr:DNA-binding domain-containing protein [Reyranella sp.]TAJ96885.1 MAG: DUF2063 domain-containing protein [Reyranella sp.]TBR28731.1 MAG: DUF2063 domain-containing protein [Reyranella sp.]